MIEGFSWNAHSFGDVKLWIVESSGLARDALHIHIGLAIFFAISLIWRSRTGLIWAVVAVLLLAFAGEVLDHIYERSIRKACDWPDHLADMVNSCIWPFAIALYLERKKRRRRA